MHPFLWITTSIAIATAVKLQEVRETLSIPNYIFSYLVCFPIKKRVKERKNKKRDETSGQSTTRFTDVYNCALCAQSVDRPVDLPQL